MSIRANLAAALSLTALTMILPGAAGIAQAADDDGLPRYFFKRGQELTYQSTSEYHPDDGAVLKSESTWQVWVTEQNDDGSWHLILRHAALSDAPPAGQPGAKSKPSGQKNAPSRSKPAANPQPKPTASPPKPGKARAATADQSPEAAPDALERVSMAYVDLFADGRYADNPTLSFQFEPRLLFPRLPKNRAELEKGWSDTQQATQVTYRYQVKQAPDEDDEDQTPIWIMAAARHSPVDELLASSTQATFTLDGQRGLITAVENKLKQDFGLAGEGVTTAELAGVETFDAKWCAQLSEEMDIYFTAQHQYRQLLREAQGNSADAETLLIDAGAILQHTAQDVTLPLIKEELNKQLAEHAMMAGFAARSARDRAELLDQNAPNWQAKDLDGKLHVLRNYKGKVVVLEFWKRSDPWCLRVVGQMEQLAEHYDEQPVVVLGMNIDRKEDDARFVAEKLGISYPVVRADKIAEKYNIKNVPTVVLVDRKGTVRDVRVGYSPTLRAELVKHIDHLLDDGEKPGGEE
jgi:peroxiredoxin